MHFTKLLTSVFLAALASTSPLVSQHASLSKRLVESGEQAGAYLDAPQGVKLNIVHGAPHMPDLANAAPGTELSYWVGIDGIYDDSVPIDDRIVIQAGFDAVKDANGQVTYDAWYEWYPNKLGSVPGFTVIAGDVVDITITLEDNDIYAEAAWKNRRTGQTLAQRLISPDDEHEAKGANAIWVIERNPDTTLANFGNVLFDGCFASGGGTIYNVHGATTIDLIDTGNTLATGTIPGYNQIDVLYTGP